ncbi:unnamed protein product, partial [Mesorhabditis spiculigera]
MDQITQSVAALFVNQQDSQQPLCVDPNAPSTGPFNPALIRAIVVKQADGTVYTHIDESQNGQEVFNQTNIQYPNGQTITSNDGQTQTTQSLPQTQGQGQFPNQNQTLNDQPNTNYPQSNQQCQNYNTGSPSNPNCPPNQQQTQTQPHRARVKPIARPANKT